MEAIREDAVHRGSPIMHVLKSLENPRKEEENVHYEYISGKYADGMPYNGVMAVINFKRQQWNFSAITAVDKPKTVLQFVKAFNRRTGRKAEIAWNGGYILNPELVGKLGIPETYIGSPLGLLISDGTIICPPLFNKPALLIRDDGSVDIRRVSCARGIHIVIGDKTVKLTKNDRNQISEEKPVSFFDLMYPEDHIPGNGKVIVRLAGNQVKEIYRSRKNEKIPIIPVGLTLSFSPEAFPRELKEGAVLNLMMPEFENIIHAVEAGPLLLDKGKMAIDMKAEGWKTNHSIRTQAARLDYTNMRGPKIAVGINKEGELAVLTINGRIRESVGATHGDMASVLKQYKMEKAMGFDPGGSSTLVVGERTLNISPYNKDYMKNAYALKPEPRAVSNAIIGFIDN